jgi:hypothetical protein
VTTHGYTLAHKTTAQFVQLHIRSGRVFMIHVSWMPYMDEMLGVLDHFLPEVAEAKLRARR